MGSIILSKESGFADSLGANRAYFLGGEAPSDMARRRVRTGAGAISLSALYSFMAKRLDGSSSILTMDRLESFLMSGTMDAAGVIVVGVYDVDEGSGDRRDRLLDVKDIWDKDVDSW